MFEGMGGGVGVSFGGGGKDYGIRVVLGVGDDACGGEGGGVGGRAEMELRYGLLEI